MVQENLAAFSVAKLPETVLVNQAQVVPARQARHSATLRREGSTRRRIFPSLRFVCLLLERNIFNTIDLHRFHYWPNSAIKRHKASLCPLIAPLPENRGERGVSNISVLDISFGLCCTVKTYGILTSPVVTMVSVPVTVAPVPGTYVQKLVLAPLLLI